jgi:hypothetical protein
MRDDIRHASYQLRPYRSAGTARLCVLIRGNFNKRLRARHRIAINRFTPLNTERARPRPQRSVSSLAAAQRTVPPPDY